MSSTFPAPHFEKLKATLANEKLPAADKPRIKQAIERYKAWITNLEATKGSADKRLQKMVQLLNEYRMYLDLEVIFDSESDFLYRQKGQLKLDNSVIEEFLPHLVHPTLLPELERIGVIVGPTTCFSSVFFSTSLDSPQPGGGFTIRAKNQDFAIARRLFFKAADDEGFKHAVKKEAYVAYVVAECKTNLDKTMFQEACATAHDVKAAVSGAKYYLLSEWLDMTPLSTAPTDIDEVIILRKAKRTNSNLRKEYATYAGRRRHRDAYLENLAKHPFQEEMFVRLLAHVRALIKHEAFPETDILARGYF